MTDIIADLDQAVAQIRALLAVADTLPLNQLVGAVEGDQVSGEAADQFRRKLRYSARRLEDKLNQIRRDLDAYADAATAAVNEFEAAEGSAVTEAQTATAALETAGGQGQSADAAATKVGY